MILSELIAELSLYAQHGHGTDNIRDVPLLIKLFTSKEEIETKLHMLEPTQEMLDKLEYDEKDELDHNLSNSKLLTDIFIENVKLIGKPILELTPDWYVVLEWKDIDVRIVFMEQGHIVITNKSIKIFNLDDAIVQFNTIMK